MGDGESSSLANGEWDNAATPTPQWWGMAVPAAEASSLFGLARKRSREVGGKSIKSGVVIEAKRGGDEGERAQI